jgi:hypothetical protein
VLAAGTKANYRSLARRLSIVAIRLAQEAALWR